MCSLLAGGVGRAGRAGGDALCAHCSLEMFGGARGAGDDALCAALLAGGAGRAGDDAFFGWLEMLDVPEAIRCVLLCNMLECGVGWFRISTAAVF